MFIGKICYNLIKIREASFAKSILAAIVIISPDVNNHSNQTERFNFLLEYEHMT